MEPIFGTIASVIILVAGLAQQSVLDKIVGSFLSGKSDKEIRKKSLLALGIVVFTLNIPLILDSNDGNGGKPLPISPPEKEDTAKSDMEVY